MKNSTVFISITILLLIIGSYLFINKSTLLHTWASRVSPPSVTDKNTIRIPVAVQYPPEFPKELYFDLPQLSKSDVKNLTNGKREMDVEYISSNPLNVLEYAYKQMLKNAGWAVASSSTPTIITATKTNTNVWIKLATKTTATTAVVIQYTK